MHHLVRSFTLNLAGSRNSITIKKIQALPRFIKFKAPPTFPASFVTRVCIGYIYKTNVAQEVMCHLHLYPNLRELELQSISFSRLRMKSLSKALDRFPPPPLRRLSLDEISFTDSEHFLWFIGMPCFSAISALDMFKIDYEKGERGCGLFYWNHASFKHDPQFGGPSFATFLALRKGYRSAGSPTKDIVHLLGKSITEIELPLCIETGLDFDPCLCPSLRRLSLECCSIDGNPSFSRLQLSKLTSLNILTHFSFRIGHLYSMKIASHWKDSPEDAKNEMIGRLDYALIPISRMPSIQEISVPKLFDLELLVESRRTGHLITEKD
ncbi:hypothetical protein K435DRAFT_774477 [Dendrothele bispora CBS 962.96]|uniref:F-box domain-containing protein n=1 Tax=Dendrothele bispora (strain CBS 962.96) TaxID=1314807 RepID=A0A4S8MN64_DENBC|nr:hypothetical protein K435DRAFT_774477 [Dendrothele bispora CBS 962.96]